jgi:hypothetical protein
VDQTNEKIEKVKSQRQIRTTDFTFDFFTSLQNSMSKNKSRFESFGKMKVKTETRFYQKGKDKRTVTRVLYLIMNFKYKY